MIDGLNNVLWVVTGAITLWRLVVLLRAPYPTPGRVTALVLFGCAFLSNTAGSEAAGDIIDAVAPGFSSVLNNLFLIGFFCGFIYFFGSEVRGGLLANLRVQAALATLTGVFMTASWLVAPGHVVDHHEMRPGSSIAHFAFNAAGSLYFGYACFACASLAKRAAREGETRWRRAFALCSFGMLLALLGGPLLRLPKNVVVWFGLAPVPAAVQVVGNVVLTVGICTVTAGLWLVAVTSSLAEVARWRHSRVKDEALTPLWAELSTAFPAIVLPRSRWQRFWARLPSPAAVTVYRRKRIESRDGLWRLSSWVATPDDEFATAEQQARLVVDALARVHEGAPPWGEPVALGAPEGDQGPEADEAALLALAGAVAVELAQRPVPPCTDSRSGDLR